MSKVLHSDTPILIVDDNAQYIQVLKRILEGGFGYRNITLANNLEDGYALVSSDPKRFRLLFVDFRFPGNETGSDFLKKLKDQALLDGKAAFLITSEPSVDNVKAAAKSGALGVVAKPFDREEIKKQLEKVERAFEVDSGESF